jgi:LPS sulfotransferase NodH
MNIVPFSTWLNEPLANPASVGPGYLICATPRSGSYFLCDLLRSTGVLGRPHEYFATDSMRRRGIADYPDDLTAKLAIVRSRGCTPNGVFGAKVFPLHFGGTAPATVLREMGEPVLIHLKRTDLLGQAISLTRAAISHAFFAGEAGREEPRFDAALIRDYLELIIRWNAIWELWFARCGVVPVSLSYEALIADPQLSIDRVASALGLAQPAAVDYSRLTMVVQRDGRNSEWRERFLALQLANRLDDLRPAGIVTLHRRVRRVLRILRLRLD